MKPRITIGLLFLLACLRPLWAGASESQTVLVHLRRLTPLKECICTLDSETGALRSTANISFRVEDPKDFEGKIIVLRFADAPIVSPFKELFADERFLFRLPPSVFRTAGNTEPTDVAKSSNKEISEVYYFREIAVLEPDSLKNSTGKASANKPPEPTPGQGSPSNLNPPPGAAHR
jgi:hypothetical protein